MAGSTTSPNSINVYLDESGDLGWTFTAPYRQGGSSRYLTIGAVCVPPALDHHLGRLLRSMYQKYSWASGRERKFSQLSENQRIEFATQAVALVAAHPEIKMHAIVVRKVNVWQHIRRDGNKLYNYMIKLALLKRMAKHDVVNFVPDPRTLKVQSGNSLPDYLQTELWFSERALTTLVNCPQDSATSRGIQFADMISGIVQAHFEQNQEKAFRILEPKLVLMKLFF